MFISIYQLINLELKFLTNMDITSRNDQDEGLSDRHSDQLALD